MSSPYRAVFDTVLPDAPPVADPFNLVRLADQKLDQIPRRAQNETLLGNRGREHNPLHRALKLLVLAQGRREERFQGKPTDPLHAGEPKGEVTTDWRAKEAVRALCTYRNRDLAPEWVDQLSGDMRYRDCPPKIRQLGRTIRPWREQIADWHAAQVSTEPTETINGLSKRIKHTAFGMRSFVQ
jgi:transposase